MKNGSLVGGLVVAGLIGFAAYDWFHPSYVDVDASLASTRECIGRHSELREDAALTKKSGSGAIGIGNGSYSAVAFYYSSTGDARADLPRLRQQVVPTGPVPTGVDAKALDRAVRAGVVQAGPMILAYRTFTAVPSANKALAKCVWLVERSRFADFSGLDQKRTSRPFLNRGKAASAASANTVMADLRALQAPGNEAGAYYNNIIGIMNDSTSLPLKEGVKMIREQVPPLLAKAIALYPSAIAKVAAKDANREERQTNPA